jgi:hypothetical protein
MTQTQVTKFLPRGCGERRIAGNAYIRTLREKRKKDEDKGDPEDYFMICPPWGANLEELGLSTQGISILPNPHEPGIYDVWDLVGAEYYTPADFIEEDKRDGTSRLVPNPQLPQLDMLTPDKSRHIFVAKALLVDAKPVYEKLWEKSDRLKMCPAGHEIHNENDGGDIYQSCTSFLWEANGVIPKKNRRLQQVFMPRWMAKKDDEYLWSYFANGWYKNWEDLEWDYAAFYWKTVSHVEIVKDNVGEKHLDPVQIAMELGNGLPFILIDDDTGETEEIK